MRLPEDPRSPVVPPAQPTRDLLLAQALDACITAERRLPGSAQKIIDRQPAWARADLQRLVGLAGSLDAAASNAIMSSEFRVAARARLMQRIGGESRVVSTPAPRGPVRLTAVPHEASLRRRKTFWVWRAAAAAVAAVLAVAATLTASASALPGEPLYSLKQAQEELGVRLAADDQERALALMRQAEARLEETARLLQLGRTRDASATTQQYDQVLERAMSSYVVTVSDVPQAEPATVHMEARLSQEHDQLQAMLQSAPEQARPELREALVATERGRALVADPRPVERALGRTGRSDSAVAAAEPTMAVEDVPTVVPTEPPARPTTLGLQRPLIALPTPTPTPPAPVVVADVHDALVEAQPQEQVTTVNKAVDRGRAPASGSGSGGGSPSGGSRSSVPQPARATPAEEHGQDFNQHASDQTPRTSLMVVAHGDRKDVTDGAVHSNGGAPAVDRTDLAALINGRPAAAQAGGSDGRTAEPQSQTDTAPGRGNGVPQAIVAHATAEPANNDGRGVVASTGGRSSGGEPSSGGAPRTGAEQVLTPPERANSASTTTTTTTTTSSSSSSSSSQHPGRDDGADTRPSPTPTATPPKPQPQPQPAALPTPTGRHDGDPERGDSPPKPPSPAPATRH